MRCRSVNSLRARNARPISRLSGSGLTMLDEVAGGLSLGEVRIQLKGKAARRKRWPYRARALGQPAMAPALLPAADAVHCRYL
jgi:hypothetical protein